MPKTFALVAAQDLLFYALVVFQFDALFVFLETVRVATECRALSFSLYLWLGDRDCGFGEFPNFAYKMLSDISCFSASKTERAFRKA